MVWRIAGLRKHTKANKTDLEVVVEDTLFETPEAVRSKLANYGGIDESRVFVGLIAFQDNRPSKEILREFALLYPGRDPTVPITEDGGREWSMTYQKQFELSLHLAFMNYFSKRQ